MNRSSRDFDWRTSPAHLDLLSKFVKGRDIAQVMGWQYLKDALNEPTRLAVDRFINEGVLVPCTLEESVDKLLTVTELKELLRERGLKLSGRKADLIGRLIQADKAALEHLVGKRQFMKCSPEALELLNAFEEQRKAAETEAKVNSHRFLMERNVRDPYREYVQYMRKYRNPGFASTPYQAEQLEIILSTSPEALSDLGASALAHLQAAVAMSNLWSDEDPTYWLPESFPANVISPRIATSYLTRAAELKIQVSWFGKHGLKARIVFSPYDIDSCDLCKEYDGKEFTQSDFPNLPLRGCTSEIGCMCELEDVWEDIKYRPTLGIDDDVGYTGEIPSQDPVAQLQKLNELLDQGLISQEEYEQKRSNLRLRAFTESGLTVDNPTETDVASLVNSLREDNSFLVLQWFDENGETESFAQIAPTAKNLWVIEYREGNYQYQALTDDLPSIRRALGRYAAGDPNWKEGFDWDLLMTHSD